MKKRKRGRPRLRRSPARRTGLPRSAAGKYCPWSESCFSCPKPDCVSDGKYYFNEILEGEAYNELVGR